jgi:hypothetical protein
MGQCNAIAHVHFDGAQLNPPAATTAQELEALLGTKPSSSATTSDCVVFTINHDQY